MEKPLKEEYIKTSDGHIQVFLIKQDGFYVVNAVDWSTRIDGVNNTNVGTQKLSQPFGDLESAERYFKDVLEKWAQ